MCLVYPVTFGIAEFAFSSLIELALEEPPVGAQYVGYGFCSGQRGAMAAILYFQEIGVLWVFGVDIRRIIVIGDGTPHGLHTIATLANEHEIQVFIFVIQSTVAITCQGELTYVAPLPLATAGVEGPRAVQHEGDAVDVLQLRLGAVGHFGHGLSAACLEVDGALCAAQRVGQVGGQVGGGGRDCGQLHVGGYPAAEPVGSLLNVVHTDV